ncbi:MAG TPA: caspase family protein [Kofleriaceae bacterium]|nr:caspase family protein [Kofleriaceae bacterium]
MSDTIGRTQLQPGDVLLYHGGSWVAKAIRLFDGTEVNHAGIYVGDGTVGEALGRGLTRRSLSESVEDQEYAIMRRLKTGADMEAVRRKAEEYLAQGNRYGYEQIVLLAILGLTRKLKLTPVLRLMLRRVLDAASGVLVKYVKDKLGESREPMICSEFVYRAYDEALPDSIDVYTLRIGAATAAAAAAAAGGAGKRGMPRAGGPADDRPEVAAIGVHPESLLAWASSPANRFWNAAEREVPVRRRSRAAEHTAPEDVEPLIQRYFEEVRGDARAMAGPGDDVSDAELLEAIDTFADKLHRARAVSGGRELAEPPRGSRGLLGNLPAALSSLFRTAADFVTPGDLLKTDSLFSLGRLDMGREVKPRPGQREAVKAPVAAVSKGEPVRRALLVGINHYQDPGATLKGCVNDTLMMWQLLTQQYRFEPDDVRVLNDERATTEAIRQRLRWLTRDVAPGSELVFHYAGHGSQVRDRGKLDELDDHMDEILCPYDLDWDDPFTDDELAAVIQVVPPGVNFTIVLDCCHSGTGTREFFKEPVAGRTPVSRFLVPPPDIALRAASRVDTSSRAAERTVNMVGKRVTRRKRFGQSAADQNAIVLAGCRSDQTSSDAWIDNDNHGAFTYALWRTLTDREYACSYEDVLTGARSWLGDNGYDQVPQLEAPSDRTALPFLARESAAGRRIVAPPVAKVRQKAAGARERNGGGHRRPGSAAHPR